MMNFRSIAEKLARSDTSAINRIRMLSISTCSLIFAIVLYHYLFGVTHTPARTGLALIHSQAVEAVAAQPAIPAALSVLANGGDSDTASYPPRVLPPEKTEVIPESTLQYVTPPESSAFPAALQDISAKAVFVSDNSIGQVLYERNADRELPEASLTKLMTAVVVREYAKPDDVVEISSNAVATEGIAGTLRAGEQFIVSDLLKVMLIVSSNDAAVAFQEHFTAQGLDLVALMNEKAKELGMENTRFMNADGLDAQGHHTTARDLAKLVSFSLYDDVLWAMLSERADVVRSLNKKIAHQLSSTNELLQNRVMGVKGGKTGYTQSALGCMITATNDRHIIIVLGSQDRFGDTKALVSFAKSSL